MRSTSSFFKAVVLLLLLISTTATAQEKVYKIVLGSFSTKQKADKGFYRLKTKHKHLLELQTKYDVKVLTKKSKNYYVVLFEGFLTNKSAKEALKEIKKVYPSAYIVLSDRTTDNEVQKQKKQRKQVNINFSNVEIVDCIKLVSKITNKNILINDSIKGKVNFVSTVPVYEDELMDIMISVLESKGYTIIQKGSIYEVVRSTEAAKHNPEVLRPGQKTDGSLMLTQSIKVQNENVDVVAAKVRHLISKNAKLVTIKETNSILVTDYPKNIDTLKEVLRDIDNNNRSVVKIVYIKNTEAGKLKARLVNVAKSVFNDKVSNEAVNIIHDENINGLVIVGNPKNVKKIQELAKKLDVESNISKSVHVFALNNSDATTVLATLNEIVSKQRYPDPELKPNISASTEINSIIAVGDPVIIKGIKLIIDELDKEKYQVYVQARIVNINKSNAENIGIKYGFSAGDVSSTGLYAMSANFGVSALTDVASQAVMDYLGGIGSSAQRAMALGATIDFLQSKGASSTISNPSILCVNNKESSIYVGKTISVSSGTTTGTSTSTSYKREDIGLKLKIKPRVSSNEKVTLDVETVLENVIDDGSNNETGQPITSKQEVKTQAILSHGESIIIGGLVTNDQQNNKTKLPFLGSIPVVGDAVFSSKTESASNDNLIVILTPYVVDSSEKLSLLQAKLGELANIQKLFNKEVFKNIEQNGGIDEQRNALEILEGSE
jgi:general secretion pathway protein D